MNLRLGQRKLSDVIVKLTFGSEYFAATKTYLKFDRMNFKQLLIEFVKRGRKR